MSLLCLPMTCPPYIVRLYSVISNSLTHQIFLYSVNTIDLICENKSKYLILIIIGQ